MDITIDAQDENVTDIESIFGFNRDLQLVQNWIETKNEVKQAFVLCHEKNRGLQERYCFHRFRL